MAKDITISYEDQLKERVKEIKVLNKNAYPSRNGLSPSEILILYYVRSFSTDKTDFQHFWYYEYAVDDPQKLLKKLMTQGFICIAPAADCLKLMTIPQIKELMRPLGLKLSGKKSELIDRLIENSEPGYIDTKITARKYDLTEKGWNELGENEYVPYFHKVKNKYGIDIWQMNKLLHDRPQLGFRDIIWGELNKRSLSAAQQMVSGRYDEYIFNRSSMCEFLLEEEKYTKALELLLEAEYYDINASAPDEFVRELSYYKSGVLSERPHISDIIFIKAHLFEKIKIGLELSDDELFQKCCIGFEKYSSPRRIISSHDMAELVLSVMNDDKAREAALYSQIESKLMPQNPARTHTKSIVSDSPIMKEHEEERETIYEKRSLLSMIKNHFKKRR